MDNEYLVRVLLYLAQSYHEYFWRTSQNYYKSKKVKMLKPELYVLFTGNKGPGALQTLATLLPQFTGISYNGVHSGKCSSKTRPNKFLSLFSIAHFNTETSEVRRVIGKTHKK